MLYSSTRTLMAWYTRKACHACGTYVGFQNTAIPRHNWGTMIATPEQIAIHEKTFMAPQQ
jgi:hypothetical protein